FRGRFEHPDPIRARPGRQVRCPQAPDGRRTRTDGATIDGIWRPPFPPPRARKANMVWWMDHIGLLVSDLARAKNFYGACLAPLGWQFRDYGARGSVFRHASSPPCF